MGAVYAEITLKNGNDMVLSQAGNIADKDVRSVTVKALVDTGAVSLVINEDIFRQLGLAVEETRTATLAGGNKVNCKITAPLRICWKDRSTISHAVVLPEGEVLLGVIPLEFMDLVVDPIAEQLVGAHGDRIVYRVM